MSESCADSETTGLAAERTPETGTAKAASDWKARVLRLVLIAAFFVCGLLVFVLGIDYHTHFATNTSGLYKVGLCAALLAATVALKRSERLRPYWRIAFAFFVASVPNVLTWYLGPLRGWLLNLFRLDLGTPQGITVGKLWDVLLKVVPILVLVKLSGDGLDTLYLKKGDLRWGMTIGLLAAGNLLTTAIVVATSRNVDLGAIVPSVPWWFLFALGNAFMEELWCRGLLLKRFEPFIGTRASVWVTSLVFALMHAFASYVTSPAEAVVIAVLTFTLGFAWALLMQKTDSIWGSVLFHLAADLYIFIGLGGF